MRTPDCPTRLIYENTNIENFLFPLPLEFSTAVSSHFSMTSPCRWQPSSPSHPHLAGPNPLQDFVVKLWLQALFQIFPGKWSRVPVQVILWSSEMETSPTVMLRVILHIKLTFILKASGIPCFISAFCSVWLCASVHSANLRCKSFRCSGERRAASAWSACKALPQGGLLMYQYDAVDGWDQRKCLTILLVELWVKETKFRTLKGSNSLRQGATPHTMYQSAIGTSMMLVSTSCRQFFQSPWK